MKSLQNAFAISNTVVIFRKVNHHTEEKSKTLQTAFPV